MGRAGQLTISIDRGGSLLVHACRQTALIAAVAGAVVDLGVLEGSILGATFADLANLCLFCSPKISQRCFSLGSGRLWRAAKPLRLLPRPAAGTATRWALTWRVRWGLRGPSLGLLD